MRVDKYTEATKNYFPLSTDALASSATGTIRSKSLNVGELKGSILFYLFIYVVLCKVSGAVNATSSSYKNVFQIEDEAGSIG